jgi:hypothetical protein
MKKVRHSGWHAYITWLGFACYECMYPEAGRHSLDACGLVLVPLKALVAVLGGVPAAGQPYLGGVAAALPHATGWPLPAVWPLPIPPGFHALLAAVCAAGWALTAVSDAKWAIGQRDGGSAATSSADGSASSSSSSSTATKNPRVRLRRLRAESPVSRRGAVPKVMPKVLGAWRSNQYPGREEIARAVLWNGE